MYLNELKYRSLIKYYYTKGMFINTLNITQGNDNNIIYLTDNSIKITRKRKVKNNI